MIQTTIAVTASLLLVACGAGKEPQSPGDSSVAANHAPVNGAAASKAPAAKSDLTLTYFNLGGWQLCGKVVPIVNGFAKEYEGKMQFVVEDGKTEANIARIAKYGLEIHGMVITDKDDNVLWSESSHNQKHETVKKAIDKALGS